MKPIIFALPGNEYLSADIIAGTKGEKGNFEIRQFPDQETYVRLLCDVNKRDVIIVCTLHQPDAKLLPLFFLCNLLRDQNVNSICLVAPYLAYMRQDKQFNSGEAITSEYFAKLLSSIADRLITIDPHLHRRVSMKEIYSIPTEVLHAAMLISEWIKTNIPYALLIGPDSESEQWVSEVAKNAGAPFIVLQKIRHGDRDVEVSVPGIEKYKNHIPVLVDDIISTARTMIETVTHLKKAGAKDPVCIGVHAVFAGNSYEELKNSGVSKVITCNTIVHQSNAIDISKLICSVIQK
ncbi:MAG: ribose-phosphate pyrophosphokinae [Bacteroidetes bacterium]|jgi:ribose-phosphate pyrophosphokinase|nr:ribose-phosphate pyrophosphokinae [Bacteroidota bacterium]